MTTNNATYPYTNASHVSHMPYHDFDASYVLMRNKIGKILFYAISWYFYQTPWWWAILWTLKWTKHYWFSECGLFCCTSNLKLAMLEKYTFMSKILFTQKNPCFMIQMVSSHIYILFFKTFPCVTHIYILLVLWQNPLNINFLGSFRNYRDNFHWTCPAPGSDKSGTQVSSLYKGVERPLRILGLLFSSTPSLAASRAL
jgi:hypothetical protein